MAQAPMQAGMGSVAGIATVHAPGISAIPEKFQTPETSQIYAGFARLKQWVTAYAPDVILILSGEHIVNFLRSNVPAFCVGMAEQYAVVEEFNLPADRPIPGDAALGKALVEYAYERGFDVSHSSRLRLDHGSVIPLHFLTPGFTVPVIPIFINAIFPPFPTLARSYALGQMIGDFIAGKLKDKRVLLVASGGLVHSVGERRPALFDYSFDQKLMEWFSAGDIGSLMSITQTELDRLGNGTGEIRCWLGLQGALGNRRPEVVAAEEGGGKMQMGMYQLLWE